MPQGPRGFLALAPTTNSITGDFHVFTHRNDLGGGKRALVRNRGCSSARECTGRIDGFVQRRNLLEQRDQKRRVQRPQRSSDLVRREWHKRAGGGAHSGCDPCRAGRRSRRPCSGPRRRSCERNLQTGRDPSLRRRPRLGMGQHQEQCVSLPVRSLLRQNEKRRVYVRVRCHRQGRARGSRQGLQVRRGLQTLDRARSSERRST